MNRPLMYQVRIMAEQLEAAAGAMSEHNALGDHDDAELGDLANEARAMALALRWVGGDYGTNDIPLSMSLALRWEENG